MFSAVSVAAGLQTRWAHRLKVYVPTCARYFGGLLERRHAGLGGDEEFGQIPSIYRYGSRVRLAQPARIAKAF
jgi:hypothetical protein